MKLKFCFFMHFTYLETRLNNERYRMILNFITLNLHPVT